MTKYYMELFRVFGGEYMREDFERVALEQLSEVGILVDCTYDGKEWIISYEFDSEADAAIWKLTYL